MLKSLLCALGEQEEKAICALPPHAPVCNDAFEDKKESAPMKGHARGLSLFAMLSLALAAACSSSSSLGSLACVFTDGGPPECFAITYSTEAQMTSAKALCNQQQNVMFVTACPTAGLVGCCTTTSGSVLAECYYAVDGGPSASTTEATCAQQPGGKWSTTM
ncbi:MAG: hypothetical protein ACLP1X_24915 [Polyangiaceae bacterium]